MDTIIKINSVTKDNKLEVSPENPTVSRGDRVTWKIDTSVVQQISIHKDDGAHNIFSPPPYSIDGQWSGTVDSSIKHDKTESYYIKFYKVGDHHEYKSDGYKISVKVPVEI